MKKFGFLKFQIRFFSMSNKEKFKKIVEYSDIGSLYKENRIYEILLNNLEKQNMVEFNNVFKINLIQNLSICRNNKIILKNEELNKIFSLITSQKSFSTTFENISEYIFENEINLNSLSYSYLINTYLKLRGFSQGYYFFYMVTKIVKKKAKLNQIKIDLSVYYNLFYNLEKIKNNHSLSFSARNFLLFSLQKDFDTETIKLTLKNYP